MTGGSPIGDELEAYFHRHRDRFFEELFEFLRIPSISTREEHRGDIDRAAEWFAESLRGSGLTAEVHSGSGHPVASGTNSSMWIPPAMKMPSMPAARARSTKRR